MPATADSVIVKDAQPFDDEKTQQIVAQFHRDGYCFLESILMPEEVEALRDAMERFAVSKGIP